MIPMHINYTLEALVQLSPAEDLWLRTDLSFIDLTTFPGVCHHLPSEPPVPSLDTSATSITPLQRLLRCLHLLSFSPGPSHPSLGSSIPVPWQLMLPGEHARAKHAHLVTSSKLPAQFPSTSFHPRVTEDFRDEATVKSLRPAPGPTPSNFWENIALSLCTQIYIFELNLSWAPDTIIRLASWKPTVL